MLRERATAIEKCDYIVSLKHGNAPSVLCVRMGQVQRKVDPAIFLGSLHDVGQAKRRGSGISTIDCTNTGS